jgi:hypothetical protein
MEVTYDMVMKEVKDFPNYFVDEEGKAYSSYKKNKLLKLKYETTWNGYNRVTLYNEEVTKRFLVHRLILETFLGPCPEGMEGCHLNNNKLDNRLSNLKWDTHTNNQLDASKSGIQGGLKQKGENHNMVKLSNKEVLEIREIGKTKTQIEIAKIYNTNQTNVSLIINRKRWKHI